MLFLPGSLKNSKSNDNQPDGEDPATETDLSLAFDTPATWVPALTLSRTAYLLRYPPNGMRSTLYARAKLDRFSKYGQPQCMVMRLTSYLDYDRVVVKEVHEWFDGRKDKMFKRVRYMLGEYKYVEYYHPGSEGEVKCWTEYPGKRIEMDFYVDGRLDRLRRREDDVRVQTTDHFEGRVDRLVSQYTAFATTSAGDVEKLNNSDISGGELGLDLYITKIVQVFARGPYANNGTDVAKKTFNVRQGQASFQYHNPEGKIGLHVKVFNHSVRGQDALGDVADKEYSSAENELVRKQQVVAISEFKDILKYLQRDVVEARRAGELDIKKQRTVFESALEAVDSGATISTDKANETETEAKEVDFLSPYLRHIEDPMHMSQKDALEVRQNCLNGYKERLLEREKIIQARLVEEKSKLARKQEQFPRTQRVEGGKLVFDEEYERQCAEAIFRIHVLEQRLIDHELTAVKKLAAMDEKLATDARLRSALKVA
jgi:hypothetical protein